MNPRDVVIRPPTAAAIAAVPPPFAQPSPAEIIQMQGAVIRELEARIAEQNIAGAQVVHVGLALAALLIELGHGLDVDTVSVPVALRDRYEGGHITISEGPDRSYVVKIRERGEPTDISIAREG